MEQLSPTTATHPVVRAVAEIHRALDEAESGTATFLPVPEKRRLLLELSREVERARGLLLHVIACADDVALTDGARNVADWLGRARTTTTGRSTTASCSPRASAGGGAPSRTRCGSAR